MIIVINGAFGVGKTTIANRLLSTLKSSMLYDPEEVGSMLRRIITDEIKKPHEKTDNFQDLELWTELTVQVAASLSKTYNKTLIVPMTIYNKKYLQYILDGFKKFDEHVYHFCLQAEEKTIYSRLRQRGEVEGNWCFQQTKKCVEAFKDKFFEEKIQTDLLSIDAIVGRIYVTVSDQFGPA